MGKVARWEYWTLTCSFDHENAPFRHADPSQIECDSWADAAIAIERCLSIGAVVIISKDVDDVAPDGASDPKLDTWPLDHIRPGQGL